MLRLETRLRAHARPEVVHHALPAETLDGKPLRRRFAAELTYYELMILGTVATWRARDRRLSGHSVWAETTHLETDANAWARHPWVCRWLKKQAHARGRIALTSAVIGTLMTGCSVPSSQSWREGTSHGPWHLVFTGHGSANATDDGTIVLSPQPPTGADTHAALVVSTTTYGDLNATVCLRTTSQLRYPQPNSWEVAWVLWHYTDPNHFYYVALKRSEWEIGKENPAYPGRQRYLATGPGAFSVRQWHEVRIQQIATTFTVWADGTQLATITDTENPYINGAIGFYTEDASAEFKLKSAHRAP